MAKKCCANARAVLPTRAHGIPNTATTRFGIASGTKGFTALAIMSLVGEGALALDTPVRSVLGDALELIDPQVTVEHLLAHTSVEAGTRFEYCNGGFVVLALMAETVSAKGFHALAAERVFTPAGMASTGFPRSDELPGSAAFGYLPTESGLRTNQLHVPVRGSGDGGAYSTLGDFAAFWPALVRGEDRFAGPSSTRWCARTTTRPSSPCVTASGSGSVSTENTPMLEGYDVGVSFRSVYDPPSGFAYTVISNTSAGAWPLVELLDDLLPGLVRS